MLSFAGGNTEVEGGSGGFLLGKWVELSTSFRAVLCGDAYPTKSGPRLHVVFGWKFQGSRLTLRHGDGHEETIEVVCVCRVPFHERNLHSTKPQFTGMSSTDHHPSKILQVQESRPVSGCSFELIQHCYSFGSLRSTPTCISKPCRGLYHWPPQGWSGSMARFWDTPSSQPPSP